MNSDEGLRLMLGESDLAALLKSSHPVLQENEVGSVFEELEKAVD
jgi:hypothetical protein